MHKIAGSEQPITTATMHTLAHTEVHIHTNKHALIYQTNPLFLFFFMLYIMCTTSDLEA